MDANSIIQITTALAIGIISLSFGIQKLIRGWKATGAETSLIDSMHKELERMSQQNTTLSLELNKLQREIINLNGELRSLSTENQRLHGEVVTLTGEVSRLQVMLENRSQYGIAG